MIRKGIHIVFLFLLCFQLHSQSKSDSLALNFRLEFNKLPLELNKKYVSAAKDTLQVETFRCYISNIEIQYTDQTSFIQKNSYHLLDAEKPASLLIPITKKSDKQIARVIFNIGIDSITNNMGALTGNLDPVKGMYWAWQSGYINTKIEGRSPSCKTHKNEFQFHIGGYLQPYYAMRKMKVEWDNKANDDIFIGIDLFPFFSNIELKETNSVMIPGKQAMQLANYCTKMFY